MSVTPWQSPNPALRQRVLAYGDLQSGKTKGLLDWAERVPGKVRIVDTEDAIAVILHKQYPELLESGKVEWKVVTDWLEVEDAMRWAFDGMGPNDLVGVDSMTDLHQMNLDWATKQITGKDMAAFMTHWLTVSSIEEGKKRGDQGFLIENNVYSLANPTWYQYVKKFIKVPKCNVYVTAHSKQTGHHKEDGQTKMTYGNYGFKPDTEKSIGFDIATVLLLGKSKIGNLNYSVVKTWGELGGERDVEYEDLATAWLFKHEGWRPVKKDA